MGKREGAGRGGLASMVHPMYVAAGARRPSHSLARQRLRRAKERKPCCRRRRGTWSARLSSSVIQRGLTSSSKVRIRSMSANTCHPTEKMLRRLADLSSETPSLKLLDTTIFFFKVWLKKRSTLDVTFLLRAIVLLLCPCFKSASQDERRPLKKRNSLKA